MSGVGVREFAGWVRLSRWTSGEARRRGRDGDALESRGSARAAAAAVATDGRRTMDLE